MIQASDLKINFGEHRVLKGINLNIKEGSVFGLLGPSGAGKTTIIKILTGQLAADFGNVSILKKDINASYDDIFICSNDWKF